MSNMYAVKHTDCQMNRGRRGGHLLDVVNDNHGVLFFHSESRQLGSLYGWGDCYRSLRLFLKQTLKPVEFLFRRQLFSLYIGWGAFGFVIFEVYLIKLNQRCSW